MIVNFQMEIIRIINYYMMKSMTVQYIGSMNITVIV